jgi:hypothetical protein
MPKRHSSSLVALNLGPLPTGIINSTLDFDLEDGDVHLSINAQKHAARRHPYDYARCLPHVAAVIAEPMYLGDDFANHEKIEMIRGIPALGSALLVAVEVTRDQHGRYNITSFYPISQGKIDARRQKGRLKIARKH